MMVAYSFQKMFAPQVEGLTKRQTVRANRKRHARPGEAVQLYTAMRTKYCRKLVTPDPICTHLDDIRLEIGEARVPRIRRSMGYVAAIEINGRALTDEEIVAFAIADGFSPERLAPLVLGASKAFADWVNAAFLMGDFWKVAHGTGAWQGVVVHWEPEAE